MPVRPREHALEDIAANAFSEAIGPLWIVRRKEKDYGIDLEAERLGGDQEQTGLLFYVQSKATDNEAAAMSVRLEVDRLNYLLSFDTPAMILRYCDSTRETFWMWATEARAFVKDGSKTTTLRFGEAHRWTAETPREIERNLKVLRQLRPPSQYTAFPVSLRASSINERISAQRAVDNLTAKIAFLRIGGQRVPLELSISDNQATLSIERIVHTSAPFDRDQVAAESTLAYLLAGLLHDLGQPSQAAAAAKVCLSYSLPCMNKEVAAKAAIALLDAGNAELAVDLALLNSIHINEDFPHVMLRMALFACRSDDRGTANERFFLSSIEAHRSQGIPAAALRYSYANWLTSEQRFAKAFSFYNGARKDDREYLTRSYYQRELGGLLFRAKRYRASYRAYSCAHELSPDDTTFFCLGDAALYAGQFADAQRIFDGLGNLDSSIGAEARLKSSLSDWCRDSGFSGLAKWAELYSERQRALNSKEPEGSFWLHLALSFHFENDVECWADAIFLSLTTKSLPLIEDVMFVAASRTGLEGYAKFKEMRQDLLARDSSAVAELDALALRYNSARSS